MAARWERWEDNVLRASFHTAAQAHLCAVLEKSWSSIWQRGHRLGLPRKKMYSASGLEIISASSRRGVVRMHTPDVVRRRSEAQRGLRRSDATRQHIRAALLEPTVTPKLRSFLGRHHTESTKTILREKARARLLGRRPDAFSPRCVPHNGFLFRSWWEAAFAHILDGLGVCWKYEPAWIPTAAGTWYVPDFAVQIPGGEIVLVEVKSTWTAKLSGKYALSTTPVILVNEETMPELPKLANSLRLAALVGR